MVKIVKSTQDKNPRPGKTHNFEENKEVGVAEGSRLNDVLGLQREQLERQEAALATSGAPLAWQGARPRREDSGLAFVNNGQAAVKAAPQTAGFQPGLPSLLTGK